jgi:hypothetical protein
VAPRPGRSASPRLPDLPRTASERLRRREPAGARQIVPLHAELVQTSYGYGTPLFDYRGERPSLDNWSRSNGEEGLEAYRREKNLVSIDNLPTGLLDEV